MEANLYKRIGYLKIVATLHLGTFDSSTKKTLFWEFGLFNNSTRPPRLCTLVVLQDLPSLLSTCSRTGSERKNSHLKDIDITGVN